MKKSPSVNVVIVTYNGERFIKKCLDSLTKQDYPKDRYSVIVVDNASKDSTQSIVRTFPMVKLIANSRNAGFSGANNIALRRGGCDYAIVLNQDSIVEGDFVRQLVSVMENDRAIAACCGAEHPYDKTRKDTRKLEEVNWVGGGITIFRMEALKKVGFFDDNYFMYNEDADLSWRLKFSGWKLYYTPKVIWHHYGWKRELQFMDSRIINASVSRIYLLAKFASLRQMRVSLRISLGKKYGKDGTKCHAGSEKGKASPEIRGHSRRSKLVLMLKIALLSVPKIIAALPKRSRIRKLPYFSQAAADRFIQEIDLAMYGRSF